MNKKHLDFGEPNPIQARALELFREGKRIVLINTGRQAGKSHFGARWTVSQVARGGHKNKLGAVIAPTFRDARVAIRKIKEVLQQDPALWKRIQYRAQPIPTFQFPNGYMIEVHSAHNPDSLRGPTFDFIWYDEVAKGSKMSFDIVMPTLLAAQGQFLGTTTPRGKQNWIYRSLYLKAVPPGHPDHDPDAYNPVYGVVTGRTRENVENLSNEAVDVLEDQYGEGSLFYNQELEGEFVSFQGLVYQWSEDRSYRSHKELPDPETCSVLIGGLDFGWHPDPTSAVVLGYKEGRWFVYDCLYENRLLTNDLAIELAKLTKEYGVSIWYADSARPDEIADLQQRGLPVRGVSKPKIVARVREMAMFTDSGRFIVSHRAPDVRNELQMYQWPPEEKLVGRVDPNPIDKFNHAMDAIGYGIWSVRYLWRNDPTVEVEREKMVDPTDDPDMEPLLEKMIGQQKSRVNSRKPSGLYGN